MNETKKKAIQEKLAIVRNNYARQLPQRIQEIETGWRQLKETEWNAQSLAALHRKVHSLAGSGGTFGFSDLGRAARNMEVPLKMVLQSGRPATPTQFEKINTCFNFLLKTWRVTAPEIEALIAGDIDIGRIERENRLVFVLESEPVLMAELTLQLDYYGYTVRPFPTLASFASALETATPCAIILNRQLSDGASLNALTAYQKIRIRPVPAIIIAERGDLNSRLEAVRSGGNAYFQKPVDISALVDTLDVLTAADSGQSYRILIVEESHPLAEHHALILQNSGMETHIINDPMEIMTPLKNFRPDLILMDTYMPHCTGLELASVLRQQEDFTSIPIIFLSSATTSEKQLHANSLGGDDFLAKPVTPHHLVSSVLSRIKRATKLRTLITHDGLTGLLNHSTTKERLRLEMERSKRLENRLVFALIDIDRLKPINETLGHPIGDRIIKSLAHLLKQRLRKTDIVGRIGGEQFAVILLDINGPTAERIINEIRENFGLIEHRHGESPFRKTFSCGIAVFPEFDAANLSEAAEKALRTAKNSGRNRVVRALS